MDAWWIDLLKVLLGGVFGGGLAKLMTMFYSARRRQSDQDHRQRMEDEETESESRRKHLDYVVERMQSAMDDEQRYKKNQTVRIVKLEQLIFELREKSVTDMEAIIRLKAEVSMLGSIREELEKELFDSKDRIEKQNQVITKLMEELEKCQQQLPRDPNY